MQKGTVEVFTSGSPFVSQQWTLLTVWLVHRVRSLFMI